MKILPVFEQKNAEKLQVFWAVVLCLLFIPILQFKERTDTWYNWLSKVLNVALI